MLVTLATCILLSSSGQDSTYNQVLHLQANPPMKTKPSKDSRDYFLTKSEKTKNTAIVLMGGGILIGAVGFFWYEQSLNQDYNLNETGEAIVNASGPYLVMGAGAAMVLTSIPLFIASGHYKKRAMKLSAGLKMEPYKSFGQAGPLTKRYPAIGLVINL